MNNEDNDNNNILREINIGWYVNSFRVNRSSEFGIVFKKKKVNDIGYDSC